MRTGRTDVWYHQKYIDGGKTHVYIVMDGSSSMDRDLRIAQADAAFTVALGCELAGHRCRMAVFQSSHTMITLENGDADMRNTHSIMKDWNERISSKLKQMCQRRHWNVFSRGGGTPMAENVRHAYERLANVKTSGRKVLIAMSDGDFRNMDSDVLAMQRSGIEVVGVGIDMKAFWNSPALKREGVIGISTKDYPNMASCLADGLSVALTGHH